MQHFNPRTATDAALRYLQAGIVPLLVGHPAIGKSSIARQIADMLELELIDTRLSTRDVTFLSGYPFRSECGTRAIHLPYAEFPVEGSELPEGKRGWLLFFDELMDISRTMQSAAYEVILDRRVGGKPLHENCLVMAAGNFTSSGAAANRSNTALNSRMGRIPISPNFYQWLEDVALPKQYDSRIIAFLSMYPNKLFEFDENQDADIPFSAPRTWEFIDKLLDVEPEITDDDQMIFAGSITPSTAAEFVQFSKIMNELTPIEDILKEPDAAKIPDSPAMKWAMITSLFNHMDEKEKVIALSKYVDRYTLDFRILFYRNIIANHSEYRQVREIRDHLREITRYIRGD